MHLAAGRTAVEGGGIAVISSRTMGRVDVDDDAGPAVDISDVSWQPASPPRLTVRPPATPQQRSPDADGGAALRQDGSCPPSPTASTAGSAASEVSSKHEAEAWQATASLAASIQHAFAPAPRAQVQPPCSYAKLLVVGEARSGKSTFIKNLFAAYAQDSDLPVGDASGSASSAAFREDPTQFATEIVVDDDAHGRHFHFTVQDTPGTHLEADISAVVDLVRTQHAAYLALESDPGRGQPMSVFPDPRFDAALYLIQPHCLRRADVKCMARLAEVTAVIPLLAKADCMTPEELAAMRCEVRAALAAASGAAGRNIAHGFSRGAVAAAGGGGGSTHPVPPFAIICSRTADLAIGRFWPVRAYPWGTCQTLAEPHSDLPLLKRLLFDEGAAELKAATEARYYAAREAALASSGAAAVLAPQFLRRGRPWGTAAVWTLGLALAAAGLGAGIAIALVSRRQRAALLAAGHLSPVTQQQVALAVAVPAARTAAGPPAIPASKAPTAAQFAAPAALPVPTAAAAAVPFALPVTTAGASGAAPSAAPGAHAAAAAMQPAAHSAAAQSPGPLTLLAPSGALVSASRLWAEWFAKLATWWTAEATSDTHRAGITLAPKLQRA